MRPGFLLWALSIALCVTVLACTESTGEDKAGTETIVLEFATINGETNMGDGFVDIDAFADHIEAVSDGLIQVEIAVSYGDGAADAEASLLEAIASGTVDGGNPAARAFSRAGISGLEPLEAPMTLSSYAALKELVASPLAGRFSIAWIAQGWSALVWWSVSSDVHSPWRVRSSGRMTGRLSGSEPSARTPKVTRFAPWVANR